MDHKETYETMEMLAASLAPQDRVLLVRSWRRRVYAVLTRHDVATVQALLPEAFRELFTEVQPSAALLGRWERDHGYVGRIWGIKCR